MCGTEMYVKLSRQITFCTCEPDFPCGYQVRCSYYVQLAFCFEIFIEFTVEVIGTVANYDGVCSI